MRNLDPLIEELCGATKLLMDESKKGTVADLASAVEKATGVLKVCADLQKKQPKGLDRLVAIAPLLTTVVTTLAVLAGAIFTYCQFTQTQKDKREAALETQWQDAFKSVYASRTLSPGVFLLQPFLDLPQYGQRAQDAVDHLLANSTDIPFFADVFATTFKPVDPANIPKLDKSELTKLIERILNIDRTLGARAVQVWDRTPHNIKGGDEPEKLSPPDKEVYYYVDYAFPEITARVGLYLRTAKRPTTINLSNTAFKNGDWNNIDLGPALLTNSRLGFMDLRDANLSKITDFQGVRADGTAWWQAKQISPELLTHLQTFFAFKPEQQYGPKYQKSTQAEYQSQLDRLVKQAH